MVNHFASILIATSIFASCERSNRTIEVQPNNNAVKPGAPGGDGSGKDSYNPGTAVDTVGSVEVTLKGAAASASKIEIAWSFLGASGTKSTTLTAGTAVIAIDKVPLGSGSFEVSGTLDGANIKTSSQDITVVKGKVNSIIFSVSSGGSGPITPGPVTPGPVTPGPVTPSGDSDVIIVPEIGPGPVTPPPGPITPTPGPTLDWDGKSFKGNAKWSIEPIP